MFFTNNYLHTYQSVFVFFRVRSIVSKQTNIDLKCIKSNCLTEQCCHLWTASETNSSPSGEGVCGPHPVAFWDIFHLSRGLKDQSNGVLFIHLPFGDFARRKIWVERKAGDGLAASVSLKILRGHRVAYRHLRPPRMFNLKSCANLIRGLKITSFFNLIPLWLED